MINPIDPWQFVPDQPLDEKVILITGASTGLGKQLALACGRYGARLILLARNISKLQQCYDLALAAGASSVALYPLNLEGASLDDYEELAAKLQHEYGRLDGLVHCAALFLGNSPFEYCDPQHWYRSLQANLNGPAFLTQACLTLLRNTSNSRLIFTVDKKSTANWGAYAVAKAGVSAFADILAAESIHAGSPLVHCVQPPAMRTALRAAAYPAESPNLSVQPDEVVGMYLYLLAASNPGQGGYWRKDCPA